MGDELIDYEISFQNKAMNLAEELQKQDIDFAAIAREQSNHVSATNGGVFGYVLPRQNDLPIPFTRAMAKLQPGEVSDAINTQEGFYIIKLNKMDSVRNSTFKRYFPDPEKRDSYMNAAWYAAVWALIDKTLLEKGGGDFTLDYEALASGDKEAVVLAIDSPQYSAQITLDDVLNSLEYSSPPRRERQFGIENVRSNLSVDLYTPEELGWVFEFISSTPVLKYIALSSDVPRSKAYQLALNDVSIVILASKMDEKFGATIPMTDDQEVLDYYNANKERYTGYYDLDDMLGDIRGELDGKRRSEGFQEWRDYLIMRYQARIYPERFEIVQPPKQ
jgi:hypothetical protein